MKTQGSQEKEGNALFTTTEIDFNWEELPEDLKRQFEKELITEVTQSIPIEQIVESTVKRQIKELYTDELGEEDLEAALTQCLTKSQILDILKNASDNEVKEAITNRDSTVDMERVDNAGEGHSEDNVREAVVEEVNTRIVAPLLFGTAVLLLGAAVGTVINGSWFLSAIILPAPLVTAYFIWKATHP